VGLPGSGKSTAGPAVAASLGWPFVDLDAEIVRREGRPVAAIFAAEGEAYFRELERRETDRLRGAPPSVIAPGGGWVTDSATVALLCPPGRMTYLRVTPETAAYRLRRSMHLRPLLKANPAALLARLLETRRAAYERAELVVDTENLTSQEVTSRIVALVRESAAG
jgi:shikimate kinase